MNHVYWHLLSTDEYWMLVLVISNTSGFIRNNASQHSANCILLGSKWTLWCINWTNWEQIFQSFYFLSMHRSKEDQPDTSMRSTRWFRIQSAVRIWQQPTRLPKSLPHVDQECPVYVHQWFSMHGVVLTLRVRCVCSKVSGIAV